MKRVILFNLSLLTALLCSAQQTTGYKSLDAGNPIIFGRDHIVYKGKTIALGPRAFFIDGQLTDAEIAKYPYVFNSVGKAAEKLTDGTGDSPMVLYLAPYVYWIDDPDDPAIRLPKDGLSPYGLIINCEWLRFYGLSDHAENVVLACNRGQTIGSQGNFTMFRFSGHGTSSENITFGNYCNVDLEYPLKPTLGREKRASAIVQAQLIHCDGDKIVARNTRFISRLNLCPFMGGKRVLFESCHFESTDDALCGTGLYLNCTLDFYSSKPFYRTNGTGAIFLNCDIRLFTRGNQYFTKADGQLAVLDTRFTTETATYIGWRDNPPFEARNYQYNVSLNGNKTAIGKNNPISTVDIADKNLLGAYRFVYRGKVIYNTYNLLRGDDDWDPMGIKELVLKAEKENGKVYTMLPVQLIVTPTGVTAETKKNEVRLTAKVYRFGNFGMNGEAVNWTVPPEYKSFIKLSIKDGTTCDIIPTNNTDEPRQVIITATTPSGLQAASVIQVVPSMLNAPEFISPPEIHPNGKGKLIAGYKLDMAFNDQSLVSWYRCSDAKGSNPMEVAVSRLNKPMTEYELSVGDIGYYMMVSVAPKHIRCQPGEALSFVMKEPISADDVKVDAGILETDFSNFSTRNQPLIKHGFWTLINFDPTDMDRTTFISTGKDAWYYGEGSDGAANMTGLLQDRNARLFYTPVGSAFGDMKLAMTVTPFKTAGQGFSIANLYMDVLLKFDAETMTGYALRFIRTTKYHDAVDCMFVKYEKGSITEISEPVSTSCFRPGCQITIEVKGNKITARAMSPSTYYIVPNRPEVVTEVNMETTIIPNQFGGFGIQYTGGSPTMINEMKVEWDTNGKVCYRNPVLGGDYPDPSVLRTGTDYYMTHSSFNYYPGLLIWHSTDLINWERIGHALHKYVGSVWAPDLIRHKDVYYIYFPAGGTNWVVTARSPKGPWSEPVDLNLKGFIDPGHVVDGDGKRYLFLSRGAVVQLSENGLSTVGEPEIVYEGWKFPETWSTECFCLESPKATVKNGYFYLTSAEGGTAGPATSHMVVSARSRSVYGPWENSPFNPVVHTDNREERWWSQGHGTLIDDIEGNYWMMYHGYEKDFHSLGRQTLMLPVEWTADHWFRVPEAVNSSDMIPGPAGLYSVTDNGLSDDFSGINPGLQWQFYKKYSPDRIKLNEGKLIVTAEGNSFDNSSPLLVNAADHKYEIQVEYTLDAGVTAGLCLYYNEQANVRIAADTARFTVFIQKNAKIRESNRLGNHGYLRILNDDNEVSFYFSADGVAWTRVERSLDATGYNHNDFGEFLSLRAGLFAFGKGKVIFDNFIYKKL